MTQVTRAKVRAFEVVGERPPRIARRRSDRSPVSVRLVAGDGTAVAPGDLEFVPGPDASAA